jgi:ATP-dependent helicase/nuclease subunit A
MTPRDDASERQIQAARPDASTWLAANAGSGKTKVLTDRVARLLLDGVEPQHILCLTYTKAAASEMQNRLFQRLGEWAMLRDPDLKSHLRDLGIASDTGPEQLSRARTLFARAIETPGGLKIQTIHSFCASLLRRFPLEAGVSPQFSEMEDRAAALLRNEIVDQLAEGQHSDRVDAISHYVSDTDLDAITAAVVNHREAFFPAATWPEILAGFGLPAGYDDSRLLSEVYLGGEVELVEKMLPTLFASGVNNARDADKLVRFKCPDLAALPVLESVFLTGKNAKEPFSAKIGSFPTKAARGGPLAEMMPALDAFMRRVEAAREKRLSLAAAHKSLALHQFAAVFLPEYERRKQLNGWLDFDDQILKARQLLNDPSVANWVLYRLDGGIDHILVDEAQDTSPAQWDVIDRLAQEFTSGKGSRPEVERTIFVVGDKKQSIYSFQGADPEAFDRMQAEFGARLTGAGATLENLTLEHSFRSSEIILRLVDLVFEGKPHAGFHPAEKHKAFKSDLPGRVDLWPVVEKVDDSDDRIWTDPIDRPGPRHHNLILSERIANFIKSKIDSGETIPIDSKEPGVFHKRQVRPGDFLILVQRRSDLFAEIIRACKAAGLEIAGADQLKVGAELAVKDLAALLRFLSTPEDSLSLAAALKSPLFGWNEQMLFDLAHKRKAEHLWQALRDRGTEYPETLKVLNDLRDRTDFLRPYDLIERILTRHDGRRKLLGRLGLEAEDGINALLGQALAYERSDIPSLTGFLVWMETDDLVVKRQVANAGNMIRVMTVHGAKGLEAPIVILPDTAKRRAPPGNEIMKAGDLALWRTRADEMPGVMSNASDSAMERQMNERLRLLYVALTRAEKWLVVAAAGDLDKEGDTWYQMVESAMTQSGATAEAFEGGDGLRISHGNWDALEQAAESHVDASAQKLPELFKFPIGAQAEPTKTVNPSDLGGAKALPGDAGLDEELAKARGVNLHLLLEILPELPRADWPDAAGRLLVDLEPGNRDDIMTEALGVLNNPDTSPVFDGDALVEVPVTAKIGKIRMHGVIDRLIIKGDTVTAIDFKTNATVPDRPETCPDGLLRQMGAYLKALEQIYPHHKVEIAILWTRTPCLMVLPHDLVIDALNQSQHLDDRGGHS